MKIRICDVCWNRDRKLVETKFRVKIGNAKLDTCNFHKNIFENCKTEADAFAVKDNLLRENSRHYKGNK